MATLEFKITEEREEKGEIVYQKVRFYSGEITTEDELHTQSGEMRPVTRLRRTKIIDEIEYTYA